MLGYRNHLMINTITRTTEEVLETCGSNRKGLELKNDVKFNSTWRVYTSGKAHNEK